MSVMELDEEMAVVLADPPATKAVGDIGMKATVGDINAFVEALGLVIKGVSGKSALPILGFIRLDAAAGRVRLTSANLTYGVTVDVPATVEVEGATAVPAKLFTEFVGMLSKDASLALTYSLRSKQVEVVSGRDKACIKTLGAEDFPVVRVLDDVTGALELPCGDVARAIRRTTFAAGVDDSRPLLTYVRVRFLPDKEWEWAATDGFRLSVATFDLDHNMPGANSTWLLPASALDVVAAVVKDAPAEEVVYATHFQPKSGRPHVVLRRGLRQVDIELGDGNFPDVHAIVPRRHEVRVVSDRSLLSAAVTRADMLARGGDGLVKLAVDDVEQVMTVSGTSVVSGDSSSRVAVVMDGRSITVGVSGKYLRQAVQAVEGDVVMEFTMPNAPIVFKPVDGAWLHIVMPMTIT